jgi:hypothetical protein
MPTAMTSVDRPGAREPAAWASALVRPRLELVLAAARQATAELCQRPDVAHLYPEFLHVQHGTIRATVPLLRTAEREAV